MKRKLLVAIAFMFIAFTPCRAQLANTTWTVYDMSSAFFLYFHFTADTLSFSSDNISYTDVSTYQVAGNNFTIADMTGCLDTGTYTFSIQNDTLLFVLVNDLCFSRSNTLTNFHWVRLLSGIPVISSPTRLNIFPNPFVTEAVLQSDIVLHNATLTITTISGQIVKQIENISGEAITLNRNNLQSGIYFIRLMEDNKIISAARIAITD